MVCNLTNENRYISIRMAFDICAVVIIHFESVWTHVCVCVCVCLSVIEKVKERKTEMLQKAPPFSIWFQENGNLQVHFYSLTPPRTFALHYFFPIRFVPFTSSTYRTEWKGTKNLYQTSAHIFYGPELKHRKAQRETNPHHPSRYINIKKEKRKIIWSTVISYTMTSQ